MATMFWTVLAIGVGWFLLTRVGKDRAHPHSNGNPSTDDLPGVEEAEDSQDLGNLDTQEAVEVGRAQAAAKRMQDQERGAQASHNQAQQDVRAKIDKARKVVKEAKLDLALPSLWEKVRYWPSWSKLQR